MCSSSLPAACLRVGRSLAAYLTLLRLGFAVPLALPSARWALTPPFHPYLRSAAGGLFSVALSVVRGSRQGVTWPSCPMEPGLSSYGCVLQSRPSEPCHQGKIPQIATETNSPHGRSPDTLEVD